MMDIINMNALEKAILDRISEKYLSVKDHLPYVEVRSRENTGGGMFVNLSYRHLDENLIRLKDGMLSTNEILTLDGLENGLGFVLDVTNGLLNFIELFTYGEETWEGKTTNFKFEKI